MTSACFPDNLSAFFSFLFRCGKPQIPWFVLSFFLFLFNFLFSKDYNKNIEYLTFRSFFLSFFLKKYNVYRHTGVHIERYTCILYYSEIGFLFIFNHHHHLVVLIARCSPTLFCHLSIINHSNKSFRLHPLSTQGYCISYLPTPPLG